MLGMFLHVSGPGDALARCHSRAFIDCSKHNHILAVDDSMAKAADVDVTF